VLRGDAVALVTQSVASNEVAGWPTFAAVALALAGIVGAGAGWLIAGRHLQSPLAHRKFSAGR